MSRIVSFCVGLAWMSVTLAGCSRKPATGPGEVRWDRDTCANCVMAVSDRHFSAQVRGGPAGEEGTLSIFDDLGCAVVWLEKQAWKDQPGVEIWVNDHRDGQWLDARKASYLMGRQTPMDYGLAAQRDPAEGSINYGQAKDQVKRVVEQRDKE